MKLCFKKGLALVMAVLMVMSTFGTMVFAADDNVIDVNCKHENNEVYSTKYHAPTCVSYGYDQVNFCHDCKFYYIPDEHVIPKAGHDYTVTHEHKGDVVNKLSVCKNCGDSKVEDITATSWELAQAADNCTLGSELVYKCTWTDCDVTKTVKGDGHNYVLRFDLDTYVKPTCEKDGNLTVTCEDCNYRAEIVIKKLNKNNGKCTWVDIEVVDSTCTEAGYKVQECTECHATQTVVIDAKGHDGKFVRVNAEKYCVNDMKCDRCGLEYTEHNDAYVKTEKVEPTCNTYGYFYEVCLACGEHVAEFIIEKLPHKAGDPVRVEATCTEPGSVVVKCINAGCGHIISKTADDEIPALGHNPVWVVQQAPTCRDEGLEVLKCARCNEFVKDDAGNVQSRVLPIQPDSHDRVGYEVTTPANCTDWGEISLHCMLCGKIDANINQINHPDDWWKFTPAVQEGDKTVTLENGAVILAAFDIRPLGHDWEITTTPATCVTPGYEVKDCKTPGCGAHEERVIEVNTHAHDINNATELVHEKNRPATCTEPKWQYYTCGDCGKPFARSVGDALGHGHTLGYEEVAGEAPTCTTDGKVAVKKCLDCGEFMKDTDGVILDGHVLPKYDHDKKVNVTYSAPTCTKGGWNMNGWYCERCGVKSDATLAYVDALGHVMVYKAFDVTCDTDGFVFYGCERCGMETLEASYIDGFVYSTGHTWGTPVVIAPTCTEEGYTKVACTACGAFEKKDPTPALGHENAAGEAIPDKCYPEFDHDFDADCVRCDHDIHTWFVTHHPGSCIWEYQYDLKLCTVCEYQKAENIEKDPFPKHFPGDEVVITPPTAGTPGLKKIKCANPKCDYTWTEEIPALGGFIFNTEVSAYNIKTDSLTNKAVNSGYLAVTITMSGTNVKLWGVEMAVAFNAEVLEFDATKTQAYNAENVLTGKFNAVTSATGAYVNMALSFTEDKKDDYLLNSDNETCATLFFKIKDDKYGYDLSFDIMDSNTIVVNKDNVVLTPVLNDSESIHVYELGNVLVGTDGYPTDAYRNIQDANAIMAILDSATADKTNELADIDKDGEVTVKDFELMMLIIVDPAQYTVYLNVQ